VDRHATEELGHERADSVAPPIWVYGHLSHTHDLLVSLIQQKGQDLARNLLEIGQISVRLQAQVSEVEHL